MISAPSNISSTAITENLLKRKWSSAILQYLENGVTRPKDIAKFEPTLSAAVMNERFRTLVRYGLVTRIAKPAQAHGIEYHLTIRGRKVLQALEIIAQLDDDTTGSPDGKGPSFPGRTPPADANSVPGNPDTARSAPISTTRIVKTR